MIIGTRRRLMWPRIVLTVKGWPCKKNDQGFAEQNMGDSASAHASKSAIAENLLSRPVSENLVRWAPLRCLLQSKHRPGIEAAIVTPIHTYLVTISSSRIHCLCLISANDCAPCHSSN